MHRQALKIIRCDDPLMWYASMIGTIVPFHGAWSDGFKSQGPAGYINIVKFGDAEVITVDENGQEILD